MPIGYLWTVVVAAIPMLLALKPLARSGRLGRLSWIVTCVINEWPLLAVYWVLAATLLAVAQGDIGTPGSWVAVAIGAVTPVIAVVLVQRSLRAPAVVAAALEMPPAATRWSRVLFAPLPLSHRGVQRISNLSYGDAGRLNTLDVYRRGGHSPNGGPILIHFHGGGFTSGRKSFEARPLMLHFARRGWVCISANYRLRPAATFPDFLVDAKRVVAWARAHAGDYGGDPERVFIAGSSAGAHLAATAALTPNDPAFQPGFEDADTSVAACVGMYGYYGPVTSRSAGLRSSPSDFVHPGAPPFLIAHGSQDTLVPPRGASAVAERLHEVSRQPVVWIELPGAQHSFDLLDSLRYRSLIEGIEAFASRVLDPERA
jgi:acetyl esterase/lipase